MMKSAITLFTIFATCTSVTAFAPHYPITSTRMQPSNAMALNLHADQHDAEVLVAAAVEVYEKHEDESEPEVHDDTKHDRVTSLSSASATSSSKSTDKNWYSKSFLNFISHRGRN